jgi:outer membrane beta-barrel protein
VTERAEAQEILLTGPLAGAPAVRQLRLYREKRIEIAPAASFTLLDEYQREILFGARLNYNLTDWLAIGAFGAFGAIKIPTGLSEHVQDVNDLRRRTQAPDTTDRRLTAVNLGPDFKKQLGSMDWVIAPQLTGIPFRGKLALFQNIYLDTDLYFFAGPAFIGVKERKDCGKDCDNDDSFDKASRVAVAPTFGLGFTFYANKWNAIGFEWRALPFSWNTGGFDTKGGGKDAEFPDNKINDKDRQFRFNQFLTLSYNFYFPQQYRVSE